MERRIRFILRKLAYYKDRLDHATTLSEINIAMKMIRGYESALMALEDMQ